MLKPAPISQAQLLQWGGILVGVANTVQQFSKDHQSSTLLWVQDEYDKSEVHKACMALLINQDANLSKEANQGTYQSWYP